MKKMICCFALLFIAIGCEQRNDTKVIEISKEKFSSEYPAMWFSPSTGEITSLKSESQEPPNPKFECWIEPQDPEFAFLDDEHGVFSYAGAGEDAFTNPIYDESAKNHPHLQRLLGPSQVESLPVYCIKSYPSKTICFIQIITWDNDNEVIRFRWRMATKREMSEFE